MREVISGRILTYDEENRIITLRVKHRVRFFYMQKSLLNRISKYVMSSRFIQFTITDEDRLYKKHKVSTIDYVTRIMEIRYRKNIVYYDIKNIRRGTKSLVNSLKNKMFLDLEMSMHPYRQDKTFTQEIIQVGIYLVDEKDNLIESYGKVIKPTLHNKLTRRTLKFLEITQEDVDKGIPFKEFYTVFRDLIKKYDPAIIVWGRNDFLALRQAYQINRLPSLKSKTRYINLLKLHKNYFNLKNDLGLFNALKLYNDIDDVQAHNALEDAMVTFDIFKGFRDVLNKRKIVDISNFK